jgi:hypothetical protein
MEPESMVLPLLGVASILVLICRIREIASKIPPDPWSQEVDLAVRAKDAIPVCINCLYPQQGHRWFCPHCGFPVGEYNTAMPYLQIFSLGELLRRGVVGPPEKGFTLKLGFFLYSFEYALLAPIYWFWLVRKACGKPICQAQRKELPFEEIG